MQLFQRLNRLCECHSAISSSSIIDFDISWIKIGDVGLVLWTNGSHHFKWLIYKFVLLRHRYIIIWVVLHHYMWTGAKTIAYTRHLIQIIINIFRNFKFIFSALSFGLSSLSSLEIFGNGIWLLFFWCESKLAI